MAIGSIQGMAASQAQGQALQPVKAANASPAPPASQAAQASQAAYYDPADTNQDGVVSPAEALAYALAHPELALLKADQTSSTSAAYGVNGSAAPVQSGLLDLRA